MPSARLPASRGSTVLNQSDTSYIFMSSVRNDMLGILENDDSPFFKSTIPFTVRPIDDDIFVDFIIKRFRKGNRKNAVSQWLCVNDCFLQANPADIPLSRAEFGEIHRITIE